MAQVDVNHNGAAMTGDRITVTCECEWTGEVTLYDIGDGLEWCCPQCDYCTLLSPVEVDDQGFTASMREAKNIADRMMRMRELVREGYSSVQAKEMAGL